MHSTQPETQCQLCPRLADFRKQNEAKFPHFHNAPVRSFGPDDAPFLIVGLAPGLKGANATGRPFTGDFAGDVLYPALIRHGFATGCFGKHADDGLELLNCRITNAVRCVPPQNKPETAEIRTCNTFLQREMQAMRNLKLVLALGGVSHSAILRACGLKLSSAKFTHGAHHEIQPGFRKAPLILANTYHTSRYNVNTGVLTEAMFDDVIAGIARCLS